MNFIPLFVVIPLAAAFLILLLAKRIRFIGDLLANIATFLLVGLSIYSVILVKNSDLLVYKVGGWIPPLGITMVVDGLTSFMLVTVNLVAWLVAIYSISYMEQYTAKGKFYALFMLMLAGMNGVIITGDMFNLFVFLEIASVASYALVAFGVENEELEAAFKYMVMGVVASCFILMGIALLYSYTSTLNMADMSMVLAAKGPGKLVGFVSILFLMGFGLKAAIVPFHAWLPDAHPSAPAPISAMLSGVFIKVLGIYALIRILFNVIGVTSFMMSVLTTLGVISMFTGAFLAMGQKDIKRMLAYSSISQIGYIILGFGIGTPLAVLGALFHLINHAIFKSLLFLNSGAVEYSTGTRDLNKLGGLNSRLPVTSGSFLVGSMSISGSPPLSGFFSKLIIIVAAVQAGHFLLALIAALVGILTLGYYLKLQTGTFFGKLKEGLSGIKEVPLTMKLAMIVLSVLCVIGGIIYAPIFREVFLYPATKAILLGKEYAVLVLDKI